MKYLACKASYIYWKFKEIRDDTCSYVILKQKNNLIRKFNCNISNIIIVAPNMSEVVENGISIFQPRETTLLDLHEIAIGEIFKFLDDIDIYLIVVAEMFVEFYASMQIHTYHVLEHFFV